MEKLEQEQGRAGWPWEVVPGAGRVCWCSELLNVFIQQGRAHLGVLVDGTSGTTGGRHCSFTCVWEITGRTE